MPNFNQNSEQYLGWRQWINFRSCLLGCLGYIGGLSTLPMIFWIARNQPEMKKERFLERKINACRKCDLSFEDLSLKKFNDADFSDANLQEAILGGTQLKNANFSRANLERVVLRQANLNRTIFTGANLSKADFSCGGGSCTYLNGTDFRGANLTGADFEYVGFTPVGELGLPNVDFRGADLSKVNFKNASLKGALMEGAKFCETIMPDGTLANQNC